MVSKICCFSPCIEQVEKTVRALEEHGFVDVKMVELLDRKYGVNKEPVHRLPFMQIQPDGDRETARGDAMDTSEGMQVPDATSLNCTKDSNGGAKVSLQRKREPDAVTQDGSKGANGRAQDSEASERSWVFVATAPNEAIAHTGYLTFATYIPPVLLL